MATKSIDTRFQDYFTLTEAEATCEICYIPFVVNISDEVKEHLKKDHIPQHFSSNDPLNAILRYYEIRNNRIHCIFRNCNKTYHPEDTVHDSKRHLKIQHNIYKNTAEEIDKCLRVTYKLDKNSEKLYCCTEKDCDVSFRPRSASIMMHLFYAHNIDISEISSEIKKLGFSISSTSLINMASETGWTKAFIKIIDGEEKSKCLICNHVFEGSDPSKEVMLTHMEEIHIGLIDFRGITEDLLNLVWKNFYLTITQTSKCKHCDIIFTKRSLYELIIHLKVTHNRVQIPSWIHANPNKSLEREMGNIMATESKDTRFEDYFTLIKKDTAKCDICYSEIPVKIKIEMLKIHLATAHKYEINSLDDSSTNWTTEYYKIQNNRINCIFRDCTKTYKPYNTQNNSKIHLASHHYINEDTAEEIGKWLGKYQFDKNSTEHRCTLCNNEVQSRSISIIAHLYYAHEIDISEEIKKLRFSISSTSLIDMKTETGWTRAYFINVGTTAICCICKKVCVPLDEVMTNHIQQSHTDLINVMDKAKDLLHLVSEHFDLTIAQESRCKFCKRTFRKSSLYGLTIHLKLNHNDRVTIPAWISTNESLDMEMCIVDSTRHSQNIPSSSDQQSSTSQNIPSSSDQQPSTSQNIPPSSDQQPFSSNVDIMAKKTEDTRFEDYFTLTSDKLEVTCDMCYTPFTVEIESETIKSHLFEAHHIASLDFSHKNWHVNFYEKRNKSFKCIFPECEQTYSLNMTVQNSQEHLEQFHKINIDTWEEIGNCLRETYKFDKNSQELTYRCTLCNDTPVPNRSAFVMSHLFYAHETDISEISEINKRGFSISSISLINMKSETGWARAFAEYEEKKAKCLFCNEVCQPLDNVISNHIVERHFPLSDCKSKAQELLNLILKNFNLTITRASECKNCKCHLIGSLLELTIHLKVSHTEVTIPSWIPTNESLERGMKSDHDTHMQNLQNIPSSRTQQPSIPNVDIMAKKTRDTRIDDYFTLRDKFHGTCDMCYTRFTVKIEIGTMKSHLKNAHTIEIISSDDSNKDWHFQYYKIRNKSIKCIFSECEQTYNFHKTKDLSRMHLQSIHKINKHTCEKIGNCLRETYKFDKNSQELKYRCTLCDDTSVLNRSASIMSHLFYAHDIDISEISSEIKKWGWTRAFFIIKNKARCNICKKAFVSKPLEDVMRKHVKESHPDLTYYKAKELLNLVLQHICLTLSQISRCESCKYTFQKSSLYGLTIHLKLRHNDVDTPSWIGTTESLDEAMGMVRDSSTHSQNIPSSDQQPPTSHDPSSESKPTDPKIRRTD